MPLSPRFAQKGWCLRLLPQCHNGSWVLEWFTTHNIVDKVQIAYQSCCYMPVPPAFDGGYGEMAGPKRSPAPRIVRVAAKQWPTPEKTEFLYWSACPLKTMLPKHGCPSSSYTVRHRTQFSERAEQQSYYTIREGAGFRNSEHKEVLHSSYKYIHFLSYVNIIWFNRPYNIKTRIREYPARILAEVSAYWYSSL